MELGRIEKGIWILTFEGKEDDKFFWIGYNSNCLESAISNKFRMLQRYGGYPSKYNNVSTYSIPKLLKEFLNKNNGYDSMKSLFVIDCDSLEKDKIEQVKLTISKLLINNNYNTTDETKRNINKNKDILNINVLSDIKAYTEKIFDKAQSYKAIFYWNEISINSIVDKEVLIIENKDDLISKDEESLDFFNNEEIIKLLKIESILQEKSINDLLEDIISEKAKKLYKLKL